MRTIEISRFGPPDVLKLAERPAPQPGEKELIVRVKAIGVNFADTMARVGVYPSIPKPPFVPGLEFAGVVDQIGSGVKGVRRGQRVMGLMKLGAYAEQVCVRPEQIVAIPREMSFEEAAAFGVSYMTAYHALVTLANISRGERVLIHAAAGGVGTAATQVAKCYGGEVFATASTDRKLRVAAEQGADHCINYSHDDFERVIRQTTDGYGVDIVLDSVGGRVFRKGWRLLAPMGRYVLYGFASVAGPRTLRWGRGLIEMLSVPLIYPPSLVTKNRAVMGFNLYFLDHKVEYFRSALGRLLHLYEKKKLKPVIGRTFAFEQTAEAHRFLQSRESYGKVVLIV